MQFFERHERPEVEQIVLLLIWPLELTGRLDRLDFDTRTSSDTAISRTIAAHWCGGVSIQPSDSANVAIGRTDFIGRINASPAEAGIAGRCL